MVPSSFVSDSDKDFQKLQSYFGKPCRSLSDIRWQDVENILDVIPDFIEQVDFLDLIHQLPDDGVENGIITNPAIHNQNQNALLTPLSERRKYLLAQHFNLHNILQEAHQISDHIEALSYMWGILHDYDKYHSCRRHNQYSAEEFDFCRGINLEIEYRENLRRTNLDRRPIQVMGDQYNIGQAGAVGPNSKAHNITFNQIWNQLQEVPDLPALSLELSTLRQEMKRYATEVEHDISVSEIAQAEKYAQQGDGPNTLAHLKAAGNWAFDIATKVGIALAAKAIEQSMQ